MTSATVHPRLGLLGNPSDGYGGRVIAATFTDFAATVTIEEADRWSVVDGSGNEATKSPTSTVGLADLAEGAELLMAALIEAGRRGWLPPDTGGRCSFRSTIPRQAGLSGSSAIVIAALLALIERRGLAVTPLDLARAGLAAEIDVLGWAAGPQDRVVQAHGGLLDMTFAEPWSPASHTRLDADRLPALFVAWDPTPAAPSDVIHADVRARYERGDSLVIDTMSEFAELAARGRRAIDEGAASVIWPGLMNEAFGLRERFWTITDADRAIVEIAQSHGAGASLAGSGGAVVGAMPDSAMFTALEATCAAAGFHCIEPTIGPAR